MAAAIAAIVAEVGPASRSGAIATIAVSAGIPLAVSADLRACVNLEGTGTDGHTGPHPLAIHLGRDVF